MLTVREELIAWAHFVRGHAPIGDTRASAMIEEVDTHTKTPADCVFFFLRHRVWDDGKSCKDHWRQLRLECHHDERHRAEFPGADHDRFLCQLIRPFCQEFYHAENVRAWLQATGREPLPLP